MKKYLFSVLLLMTQLNVALAEISDNATISFQKIENGYRISLENVEISKISDCFWNKVSICDQVFEKIQNNEITVFTDDSKTNIDIPLTEADNGILDNSFIFSIIFSSGEILSSYVIFDAESKTRWLPFVIRWIWTKAGGWKRVIIYSGGITKGVILNGAKFLKRSAGTKIYEKSGGFARVQKDFYSLKPSNIQIRKGGKLLIGNKKGETVIARDFSTYDGRATLEFQKYGRTNTKIRYNP